MNVLVPLDHFPVNALTSKVFSFMVKKGKQFLGKVTPLFASMLVQPTGDEGATSERPSEPQPTPSPPYPSKANVEPQSDPSPRPSPTTHILDSIPEDSGGKCYQDTAITKAGTKLLLHRAHFSCSCDTLRISTLKASAADT
ncbi:hypothetical protein Tco_0512516 [Tanacetum coccineum]